MGRALAGHDFLVEALTALGIRTVFGIPGSESVEFFDALRRSSIRTVLATSEREAGFMANGYYRASGRPAVVTSIGGPGFTNSLTGLAEAREDSVALLHLLITRNQPPGMPSGLHDIDHRSLASSIVKEYRVVDTDLPAGLYGCYAAAVAGEPGPVVLEIDRTALTGPATDTTSPKMSPGTAPAEDVSRVAELLHTSRHPLLFVGQGATGAADNVTAIAEGLGSPVLSTGSGRGILADRHPLAFSAVRGQNDIPPTLGRLLDECDVILALGCKLTHNGTFGHRLNLPAGKLVRVDASREVLAGSYPARLAVEADVPRFLHALLEASGTPGRAFWDAASLQSRKASFEEELRTSARADAALTAPNRDTPEQVFASLRSALPDDACLVTDSGRHQFLARSHFEVRSPRSLIVPADFQSMGYGLPAAIGAKLSDPDRPVVALIGDGGFAMTAMEVGTAVREGVELTVVVVSNGTLELIRESQLRKRGMEHAVRLTPVDLGAFSASVGARYARWEELDGDALAEFVAAGTPGIIELRLTGSRVGRVRGWAGRARGVAERMAGPEVIDRLRQRRGPGS